MDFLGPIEFELFFKIIVSFILGIIVGIEREFAGKEAGPRTYSLVAIGTTLFTIMSLDSIFAGENARIIAQIVTGIGFLGAGLIIFHKSKVHGLATAAGMWSMAAIGIAVGMGYYAVSIFAVLMALLSLYVFRKINFDDNLRKLVGYKDDGQSNNEKSE